MNNQTLLKTFFGSYAVGPLVFFVVNMLVVGSRWFCIPQSCPRVWVQSLSDSVNVTICGNKTTQMLLMMETLDNWHLQHSIRKKKNYLQVAIFWCIWTDNFCVESFNDSANDISHKNSFHCKGLEVQQYLMLLRQSQGRFSGSLAAQGRMVIMWLVIQYVQVAKKW